MRISVIIPVYNCQKWLDTCILSVVSQMHVKEILLIDDGSTDGSVEIAQRWMVQDDRIKLYSHACGTNKGRSATRNVGINKAQEDWVAFLDADDAYLPHRFDHIEPNDLADGIYDTIKTEYVEVKLQETFQEPLTGIQAKVRCKELLEHLIIDPDQHFSLNGLVVKKSCLEQVGGFDESLNIGEDTDLIWRLADQFCLQPSGYNAPVAIRRVHGDNTFHNVDQLQEGRFLFYKKWRTYKPHTPLSHSAKRKIFKSYLAYHPEIRKSSSLIRSRFIRLMVVLLDYIGIKL